MIIEDIILMAIIAGLALCWVGVLRAERAHAEYVKQVRHRANRFRVRYVAAKTLAPYHADTLVHLDLTETNITADDILQPLNNGIQL